MLFSSPNEPIDSWLKWDWEKFLNCNHSDLILEVQRSETIDVFSFHFSQAPCMTMGNQGVWQWSGMGQASSMTSELNQLISDPWLIKTLESWIMKTLRTQILDPQTQRFSDFQSLGLRELWCFRITHFSELELDWSSPLEMTHRGLRTWGPLRLSYSSLPPSLSSSSDPLLSLSALTHLPHTPSVSLLTILQPVTQLNKWLGNYMPGVGRQAGLMQEVKSSQAGAVATRLCHSQRGGTSQSLGEW